MLWGLSGCVSLPQGSLKHGAITFKHIGSSCTENGTRILMDTRWNISQGHALRAVKGSNTLGYINMRVASRLREGMICLLLSTLYAAPKTLHPVFSSSVQKRCLQTGRSLGEVPEMVRAGALGLWEEAGGAGLGLELRRLWGNLPFGRGCPETFHPWRFSGLGWTRPWASCSALSRSLS